MNNIGYNCKAIIYSLNDEKLQVIKCKRNTKKVVTSGFMGSGKQSLSQTLEIATRDKLQPNIKASQCRVLLDGDYYLITGIFTSPSTPLQNKNRTIRDTILSLQ